jgi:hypothetical protein
MRRMSGTIGLILCGLICLSASAKGMPAAVPPAPGPLQWPQITQVNRPWTRWWWMGSAVDKDNLDALLQQYHDAGVGGVEICPLYGVSGYENRYIPFLSPKWMQALDDATNYAHFLDMGFDMTTGTGWPMGGPDTSLDDASSTVTMSETDVAAGRNFNSPIANGRLQCVFAISDSGKQLDLTSKVAAGKLDWTAPDENWKVFTVVQRGPAMKVKRAAPGGEGDVIDPFSTKAMDDYLARFDKAFAGYWGRMPRAQFHDSYEYVGNWTDGLFNKFKQMRGYDLRTQLPALMGEGGDDIVGRVLCDYRQTMADLHMAFIQEWVQWCHKHKMLAREQAHGAPANILDLYAEADIPETETFGVAGSEENMPMNKFASSAAHVTGKILASSESFTWLGEHFQVSWAQIKPVADYLFLSGINHMLFQGMDYSPKDAPWPGWLFYAAVDFSPDGGLWHDLPKFNNYVAHVQSILQAGKPANDVLLYFPVYDIWQRPQGTLIQFAIGGNWVRNEPFYATAVSLESSGVAADFVSDTQLAAATYENGAIHLGGNSYRAIVVPPCRFMPPATLAILVKLARAGGQIVVQDHLPQDVPGLADLQARQAALGDSIREISATPFDPNRAADGAAVGLGNFWVGTDLNVMLVQAGVVRETMADLGLRCIRRWRGDGYDYFIVNRGQSAVDDWITLAKSADSAVLLDPMNPDRIGVAAIRQNGTDRAQVYLQLQPGESCILRTHLKEQITGPAFPYWQKIGDPITISGTWKVHFVEGGPTLPADYQSDSLGSWTTLGDAEAKRFAGTGRYTIDFDLPATAIATNDWSLDLGKVCDGARVTLNGHDLGTLISAPFTIQLSNILRSGHNQLIVDVTNLAANRIADMDRRGVKWKIFHEINFVGRDYHPFDASHWPLRDSGLIGPVQITPLAQLSPDPPK